MQRKNLKRNWLKYILIPLIGIGLAGGVFFAQPPEQAHALDGGGSIGLLIKETIADFAGWMFGDQMLTIISNEILDWAQTDFQDISMVISSDGTLEQKAVSGDSTFIENPTEFFANLQDDVGIYFLHELDKASENILPGFRDSVIAELARQEQRRNNPLSELEATLTEDEINDFMDDFSEGGWERFLELTSNPQNYYDGALLSAQLELDAQQREAVQQTLTELEQGDGFLTIRRCDEFGGLQEGADPRGCLRYEEVTPGQIISERVNRGTSTDIERIQNADEITEVVAVVVRRLFGEMTEQGLSGVSEIDTGADIEEYQNEIYDIGIGDIKGAQDEFIQDAEGQIDKKIEEYLCKIMTEEMLEGFGADPESFDVEAACDVPDPQDSDENTQTDEGEESTDNTDSGSE